MAEILVPLDGSTLAEQILPCARLLAHGLPADIVLLRAISPPIDAISLLDAAGVQAAALIEPLEREALAYLDRTAAAIRSEGYTVKVTACDGPAADCILDCATGLGVNMILMTTHGYTGITRWTRGSVAERVLQTSSVPVLMLKAEEGAAPPGPTAHSCRRILVPLDGSRVAETVLPIACDVARATGAELILFHVPIVVATNSLADEWRVPAHGVFANAERDAQLYLDGLAARLRAERVQVSTATEIGAVAQSILDYAETNQIGLIAMCTHGRSGLGRWHMGSVADRVLREAGRPVLLVRANHPT